MPRRSKLPSWWPYGALFLFALAIRVIYLLEIRETDLFRLPVGDGYVYAQWAEQIRQDWMGREVFYQAPLYPYFIALLGGNLLVLRIAQFILGAASCVFLALAGERFFSKKVGLLAGALLAVYAPSLFYEGLIQKSALDLALITLLLWALGRLLETRKNAWSLAAGLALGLLCLTRENALLLIPIVLAWILVYFRRTRLRSAHVWLFAAGLALALTPAALRNYWVGGEFVLTTSQFGPNFYIGNNPNANGTYQPLRWGRGSALLERLDATELAEEALGRKLAAREVSRYWTGRTIEYIASNPSHWAALMARKGLLAWSGDEISDTEQPAVYRDQSRLLGGLWMLFHFGTVLPLAAAGVVLTWRERRNLWALYWILLGLAGGMTIFYVVGRYRFPMTPILLLFAAAGALRLFELARKKSLRELLAPGLVLGIAIIIANLDLLPAENHRAMAYYNLGVTFEKQGDLASAQRCYSAALREHPGFVVAYNNLGRILAGQGKLEEAILHYRQAIRLKSDDAVARVNLGNALLAQGKAREAAEEFRAALRVAPGMPQAQRGLERASRELETRQAPAEAK